MNPDFFWVCLFSTLRCFCHLYRNRIRLMALNQCTRFVWQFGSLLILFRLFSAIIRLYCSNGRRLIGFSLETFQILNFQGSQLYYSLSFYTLYRCILFKSYYMIRYNQWQYSARWIIFKRNIIKQWAFYHFFDYFSNHLSFDVVLGIRLILV